MAKTVWLIWVDDGNFGTTQIESIEESLSNRKVKLMNIQLEDRVKFTNWIFVRDHPLTTRMQVGVRWQEMRLFQKILGK